MPVKKNLIIDIIAFVSFLIVMDPRVTGIAVHEWLSVAFAGLLVVHVLIHWAWLASATRRLLKAIPLTRGKLIVNALIFIGFTVATMSGFMVSKSILELFGMHRLESHSWREVHEISSNLTLLLTGIHVALNWSWVKKALGSVVTVPSRQRAQQGEPATVPASDKERH